MGAQRRLGLILPPGDDPWRRFNLEQGFGAVAAQMLAQGWAVDVLAEQVPDEPWPAGAAFVPVPLLPWPVIGGPGSTSITRSLDFGHRLWACARTRRYDALLAPLAGGVLQPCLMARELGELDRATALLLWGDAPTAARLLADMELASLGALADDALERQCAELADAVFAPGAAAFAPLRKLGVPQERLVEARLGAFGRWPISPWSSGPVATLTHMGPGRRAWGADRFLDEVELRAEAGTLPPEGIRLLGPWRDRAYGLSKDLIGLRALNWAFDFGLDDAVEPHDLGHRLARGGPTTLVFSGPTADDDALISLAQAAGHSVELAADHRLANAKATDVGSDWPALIERVTGKRRATTVPAPLGNGPVASICIVHRDRPEAIVRAVASVAPSSALVREIIVADAGSVMDGVESALAIVAQSGAQVLRLPPMRHRAACQAAAAAARGDVLVFLDDDNAWRGDGAARLIEGLLGSEFDIVVTNLALHQNGTVGTDPAGSPMAIRAFIGEAHVAGLFFNCWGDSSLAIRRTAFDRVGGFGTYEGAGNDWAFLARARAAGLRIGVLQDPAVDYSSGTSSENHRWRKRDAEGARQEVVRVSALTFDEKLLALLDLSQLCHIV
ncbi:glycosyltransferase family 2 protein [Novosphingobium sp.]|uniref:glycosyltransferase family 2 protein n=1 Tax=Novosphingobium sp. TaxID=1874826 RepID=UPI0038B7E7AE